MSALAALADWIEDRLSDELASRQLIAETALARIRELLEQPAGPGGDRRVIAAREFLDAIRPYKVANRRHSVLVREDAELRKMLGRLLDYVTETGYRPGLSSMTKVPATGVLPGGSATLTPADLLQVAGALSHAAEFLTERAAQYCYECAVAPAGACESHVDDLDQAQAYRAVAVRLGEDR